MQAIILAAGMGRRLGDLTQNNTKCMVRVNGVPMIDRMLAQLARLDLKRVVIVVGYESKKLINHIGDRYADRMKIEYVHNPIYDRTNNIYSLALAKEQLQADDTLLLESDLVFEDSLLDLILETSHPNVALVAKYETWMDGTMVRINSENDILNFVPKKAFRYKDVSDYYKTVNIYKFSREFSKEQYVPFLEAYSRAMGNNEYYEQVLRILTGLEKINLKALPIGSRKWYEIDDIQDLDIAETIFAPEEEKLGKFHNYYGGYWRFPHLLDFCYLVNPYFPTERMKDEMRANFDSLLTEYPSGARVNALLGAKYFGIRPDYVAVGNGAAEIIKCVMELHTEGKVGLVLPTFEEYPNRLGESQMVAFIPPNWDFAYSADDLKNFFGDTDIKTLLIVNPDNPSGNFISVADVLMLAEWCAARGIRFIVDESFVDFTRDYTNNSLLHNNILQAHPHMIVVKSISKSYGVPGLRLGIVASSDKELIAHVKKEVAIWNINSFGEFYMQIFSKYEKNYYEACEKFVKERERLANRLAEIPYLKVIPSQANYFLCAIIDRFTSHELTSLLLARFDILIKDCGTKKAFAGRNYVRIAVRNPNDNDTLVAALKQI